MGGIGVFIIFFGAIAGMAAINGKVEGFFNQVRDDMFGTKGHSGFLIWVAAILVIAAGMRALDMPDVGKAFIVLLIVVFLLSNGGLLGQLQKDIASIGQGSAPVKGTGK